MAKPCTLLYHESPNQKRASTNCHKSFVRYYFKDFMRIHQKCTAELYSFLVSDMILPSDNPLWLKKILLEKWLSGKSIKRL